MYRQTKLRAKALQIFTGVLGLSPRRRFTFLMIPSSTRNRRSGYSSFVGRLDIYEFAKRCFEKFLPAPCVGVDVEQSLDVTVVFQFRFVARHLPTVEIKWQIAPLKDKTRISFDTELYIERLVRAALPSAKYMSSMLL